MIAITFKVLVAVGCGLLGAWLLRRPALDRLSDRAFLWQVVALQLALGLGLFVLLYGVGNQQVSSDVPGYYLPAARAALAGQLPLRDFPSSYAPLFAYLGAALVSLWNSGKVFALFAILVNALALVWWHCTALECFGRQTARQASLLYATSGHLLIESLLGTSQTWIAALLAGSALLLVRHRDAASGLAQALAICTTKFLAGLFWPVLVICSAQRMRWFSAAALTGAAVYAAFGLAGADLLYPIHSQSALLSSGNLPYLLDPLLNRLGAGDRSIIDDIATLGALAAVTVWIYARSRSLPAEQSSLLLMSALALTGVVFMLVSKKSYTSYAVFFMYPAIVTLALRISNTSACAAFLLVFNVLLVAEPSLWFHLGGNGRRLSEWLQGGNALRIGGFVCVDLALVGCYVYLAAVSAASVRRTAAGATSSRSSSQSATARSLV